jgi:hypothetical protein
MHLEYLLRRIPYRGHRFTLPNDPQRIALGTVPEIELLRRDRHTGIDP